jgi:hypothetical protein
MAASAGRDDDAHADYSAYFAAFVKRHMQKYLHVAPDLEKTIAGS